MAVKNDAPIISPFNPLDKAHLAEHVARAALESSVHKLPPDPFYGAGVYIIYYIGDHPIYRPLALRNRGGQFSAPIYVGKAVPPGARKGGLGFDYAPTKALTNRLTEHSESIEAAVNLNLSDFYCRYLVTDEVWIPLAESLLIEKFNPVWNYILDGFGNHDPGKGRVNGKMPFWDCVHPGRAWANRLQPCGYTKEQLESKVISYLSSQFE